MPTTNNDFTTMGPEDWAEILWTGQKRLIWKECRLLLPACIGLTLLASLGMLLVGCLATQSITDNGSMFIGLALGGAIMTAMVCGAMTFSPERENRTDTFLARLPFSGKKLAGIKILTAGTCFFVFYFIAIVIASVLFALFFGGQNLLVISAGQAVLGRSLPIAFLMPVMCFLWSLMLSRYLKKTLNVVLLAAAGSVVVPVLLGLFCNIFINAFFENDIGAGEITAIFIIQILILTSAVFIRSENWLRSNRLRYLSSRNESKRAELRRNTKAPSKAMVALAWQTFRLHWVGCLIAAGLGVTYVAVILPFTDFIRMSIPSLYQSNASESWIHWIELSNDLFAALLGAGFGLALFSSDQSGSSYRFFQQRADYPRRVWFSRVLVLLAVGLWVTVVIAVVNRIAFSAFVNQYQLISIKQAFAVDQWYGSGRRASIFPAYFLTVTLRSSSMFFVVSAVGQLVSIYCRHGILNALIGLAACSVTIIWVRYLNWYQAPIYFLGWPLGVGALLISWWYAPAWIRGTKQFSSAIVAVALMGLISMGCIFGLRADRLGEYAAMTVFNELDRLYENPNSFRNAGDPRFSVANEMELAVGEWERACEEIRQDVDPAFLVESKIDKTFQKDTPFVHELFDSQRATFERVVDATVVADMRYYFLMAPDVAETIVAKRYKSVKGLIDSFKLHAIKAGDSEIYRRALLAEISMLMHQSRSLSLVRIEEFLRWADQPDREESELISAIDEVESLISSSFSIDNNYWLETRYFSFRRNPVTYRLDLAWESERKKRKAQKQIFNDWEVWKTGFRTINGLGADYWTGNTRSLRDEDELGRAYAPMRDEELERYRYYYKPWSQDYENMRVLKYLKQRLALAAWKQETGAYPNKLVDLVGKYLNARDDLSNSYYPEGLDLPAVCRSLLDV